MKVRNWLLLTCGVLVATLIFFEYSDLDLRLQQLLYDAATRRWLVDADAPLPRLIFYDGIKWLLIAGGAAIILAWLASFRAHGLRPWRRLLFFLILSLGLVPLSAATGKKYTNVFCPSDLALFSGDKPYVKLFEPMPASVEECGRCFPAGHASGGFSLMALYFLSSSRRRRAIGLCTGLGLGWVMGAYQMAKGAHFLSHTVVTMELAWLLILLFYGLCFQGWRTPLGQAVCQRGQASGSPGPAPGRERRL